MDERDAEDAMYSMDGKVFGGREIAVRLVGCACSTPVSGRSMHERTQFMPSVSIRD